ncbi:hypothetical protein NDA00_16280 [Funiculus sociatus GB2-M2]|nr:hypothetical protein [Trichocoleus sp. FACHB-90]
MNEYPTLVIGQALMFMSGRELELNIKGAFLHMGRRRAGVFGCGTGGYRHFDNGLAVV